jgi:hypothetical protein
MVTCAHSLDFRCKSLIPHTLIWLKEKFVREIEASSMSFDLRVLGSSSGTSTTARLKCLHEIAHEH